MLGLVLYAMTTPESDIWFDQIAWSHANLSSGAFTAVSTVSGVLGVSGHKYEIRFRWPSDYRMKSVDKETGAVIRDVTFDSSNMTDYNPSLGQYTETPIDPKVKLNDAVEKLEAGFDPMIAGFATPTGVDEWIEPLRKLRPWTAKYGSKTKTLTFKAPQRSIVLHIRTADSLITGISIKNEAQTLGWSLTYHDDVGGLKFVPPSGACKVAVFDQDMRPPKYSSDKARSVALKMFDAYNEIRALGFKVRGDEGTTSVSMRGEFVRQDDDVASWTYDGKTLTAYVKGRKRWYSGHMNFNGVLTAIADLGTRVDPTLRLLMTKVNPYRKRLGDGATVKYVGTMKLHGEPATIIESVSDNAKITLIVRDEDGLVLSSSVQAGPNAPTITSQTNLEYEYFPVAPDAATKLRLQPSGSVTVLESKPTKT